MNEKSKPASTGNVIRITILAIILVAAVGAFGYEKMFVSDRINNAKVQLAELKDDPSADRSSSAVRELIGFEPVETTEVTETYRWKSLIGQNNELNVIYDRNAGDEGRVLKSFQTKPLTADQTQTRRKTREADPPPEQARQRPRNRNRANSAPAGTNPMQAGMEASLNRMLETKTLEEIYESSNDKIMRSAVRKKMELVEIKTARKDICAACGEDAGSTNCCNAESEICAGCTLHHGTQICCFGIAPICNLCGEEKGSENCCNKDAETCALCGFQKASLLCCSGLKPGEPVVYCRICGHFKGSKQCCVEGARECTSCGYHQDSPLCLVEQIRKDRVRQEKIDKAMSRE